MSLRSAEPLRALGAPISPLARSPPLPGRPRRVDRRRAVLELAARDVRHVDAGEPPSAAEARTGVDAGRISALGHANAARGSRARELGARGAGGDLVERELGASGGPQPLVWSTPAIAAGDATGCEQQPPVASGIAAYVNRVAALRNALGASSAAWSYDPSTGDVVTRTASIEGGLPRFADRCTGRVSVELALPRQGAGRGRFVVDGTASSWIGLSEGAVVLPAACLLRETQRVTLAQFERR